MQIQTAKHLANTILDEMLTSDDLAPHLPICQSIAGLDKSGLVRLHKAVTLGKTPIVQFHYLAMGGAPSEIAPPELKKLVLSIAKKDGGLAVAFDIIRMRIHGDKTANRAIAKETISAGRTLLGLYQFTSKNDRDDHTLGTLVKVCLADKEGVKVAETICKRLRAALLKHAVTPSNFDDLIKALVSVQPAAMLDGLVDSKTAAEGKRLADLFRMYRINALGDIPPKALMDWCAIAPKIRFPLAATILSPLKPSAEHEAKEFSETALALLRTAPDPEVILKHFIERIYPRSYSGSLANILEKRSMALDALFAHPNPSIATMAKAAKVNLAGMIDRVRLREAEESRNRDQSFE